MPGCPKDEPRSCDYIGSWECYNNTVRNDCCQTCEDNAAQLPAPGCEYGDRVQQCTTYLIDSGRLCYNNTIRRDCCYSCQSYELTDLDCLYGDRIKNCDISECYMYSNQRLQDCCFTCQTLINQSTSTWSTWSPSSSTDRPVTNVTSESSGVPEWAIPVAASIGGVLVLLAVIVTIILCRRNKKSDNLSPIDDKMYNEYKLSKRPPMAPPRHPSTEIGWAGENKDSEYAYINPDHVGGPQSNGRRTGNDPLPPTPAEYLDLNDANIVVSEHEYTVSNDLKQHENGSERAPSNKYDTFPAGSSNNVTHPDQRDIPSDKL